MENKVIENYSLDELNTFGVKANARFYIHISTRDKLKSFIQNELNDYRNRLILGGGSNLLFVGDYDGLVLHPQLKGIGIIDESEDHVWMKAACGEDWDTIVAYCVERGFGGLENLSLIPGNVGSVPIQNIGAYGVEAKEIIERVTGFDLISNMFKELTNEECKFAYRDSIFKNELAGQFIVTDVVFRLTKQHELNTGYAQVKEEVDKLGERNIINVRQAIINIRNAKLPDPDEIGNAGSFFKNPVVSIEKFREISQEHPSCPGYNVNDKLVKIPAAWLIEACNWKGERRGDAGVYKHQPLVLVNYGNATGNEIFELSKHIQDSVHKKFNIQLEREVTVIS